MKEKGFVPSRRSLQTPLSPILEILRSAIPFELSAIRPTSATRPLFGKVRAESEGASCLLFMNSLLLLSLYCSRRGPRSCCECPPAVPLCQECPRCKNPFPRPAASNSLEKKSSGGASFHFSKIVKSSDYFIFG